MTHTPSAIDSPFLRLGGEAPVRALVERFYDAMTDLEPALARPHPCDDDGRVSRASRDRFALFFIGWLGGPQDYVAQPSTGTRACGCATPASRSMRRWSRRGCAACATRWTGQASMRTRDPFWTHALARSRCTCATARGER